MPMQSQSHRQIMATWIIVMLAVAEARHIQQAARLNADPFESHAPSDRLVDNLVDKLLEHPRLQNSRLRVPQSHHTDMDTTALGKPGRLEIRHGASPGTVRRAFTQAHRGSATSAWPRTSPQVHREVTPGHELVSRAARVWGSSMRPQDKAGGLILRAQRDEGSGAASSEFPTSPRGAPDATGSLLGAISLVAGTTVGAGILALPAKTFEAGLAPSTVTLLGCWAYMCSTGLLLAEVNVNTLCSLQKGAVSIASMAEETLGTTGSRASGLLYVFIHYALLVAYMLQGGSIMLEYLGPMLGSEALPTSYGPLLFAVLAGGALFVGSEKQVEQGNNILFAGVLGSFALLVALGFPQIDASLLARSNPIAVVPAVPICILALVYHNVVPTICYQLGCDLNKVRTAIIAGSGIPTLMFIVWNLVILGSVPPEAATAAASAGAAFDPLEGLRKSGGAFGADVRAFSLLAIATSFIGFVLGLVEYFSDVLAEPLAIKPSNQAGSDAASIIDPAQRYTPQQKAILFACTLLPPLLVAEVDPTLFFAALDYAGTYGILVLFGIIPAAMAYKQRYSDTDGADLDVPAILPGGQLTLALIAAGASATIAYETYDNIAKAVAK